MTRRNAPLASLRAITRLAAERSERAPTGMIEVGDRTSFSIACNETNGAVSRTITANHRAKNAERGAGTPRLTHLVIARAQVLWSTAAAVDIPPYGEPINL